MTDTLASANDETAQSAVWRCYMLMGISFPLMLLTPSPFSGIGLAGFLIGVAWAYVLRSKALPDSLVGNHARWMIRTFWISSVYMIMAMLAAGAVISSNADPTNMQQLSQAITNGSAAPEEIAVLVNEFMRVNFRLMMVTMVLCLIPVIFHAEARFFIGFRDAKENKPIENITTWLVR